MIFPPKSDSWLESDSWFVHALNKGGEGVYRGHLRGVGEDIWEAASHAAFEGCEIGASVGAAVFSGRILLGHLHHYQFDALVPGHGLWYACWSGERISSMYLYYFWIFWHILFIDWLPLRNPICSIHPSQHPCQSHCSETCEPGHALCPVSKEVLHRVWLHWIRLCTHLAGLRKLWHRTVHDRSLYRRWTVGVQCSWKPGKLGMVKGGNSISDLRCIQCHVNHGCTEEYPNVNVYLPYF